MLVSAAVNLGLALYLYPVARRTDSAALRADAAHHLTDVYTSVGVAGGLFLAGLTGKDYFDPLLAIGVAVLIMWTAWQLVSRSTRVLLDEALPADELEMVRATVKEHRGQLILGYHKLRARRAGSKRQIDLHVTVPDDMPIGEAHDIAEHIEADITARLPERRGARARRAGLPRARGRVVAEPAPQVAGAPGLELDAERQGEASSTTVRAISAIEKAQATVL